MADLKISEMTAAATLTGAEVLPALQSAANVRTTVGAVADHARLVQVTGVTTAATAALGDRCIRSTGSGAAAITLPPTASVAIPVGRIIQLRQAGTGSLTVVAGAGVTLNVPTGHTAAARAQGSTLAVHKVASDEWDLTGDLA